jgi:PD-(D/E)XK nuclease superfamily
MKRIQSYSSISLYKKCPRQWEWRYVHGHYGPPGAAADRGTEIHALLEEFFKGAPYPSATKALVPWQRFMENITQYDPTPEAEWAVTEDWTPCNYSSPEAYIRGKADLVYNDHEGVRHILDWKTGRIYPEHVDQGRAYVALDPLPMPMYATEFVYIDLPVQTVKHKYHAAERMDIKERLTNTVEAISADTTYEPTPSPQACRYCPLSYKKGGNCTRAAS